VRLRIAIINVLHAPEEWCLIEWPSANRTDQVFFSPLYRNHQRERWSRTKLRWGSSGLPDLKQNSSWPIRRRAGRLHHHATLCIALMDSCFRKGSSTHASIPQDQLRVLGENIRTPELSTRGSPIRLSVTCQIQSHRRIPSHARTCLPVPCCNAPYGRNYDTVRLCVGIACILALSRWRLSSGVKVRSSLVAAKKALAAAAAR